MKKLESLRAHLLQGPKEVQIESNNLKTFAEKGKIVSASEGTNRHFEIKYLANVVITDYSGAGAELFYWLLLWVHKNQPDLPMECIEFEVEVLDEKAVDVAISVALTENIRVESTPAGIVLHRLADPSIVPVPLTDGAWQLDPVVL